MYKHFQFLNILGFPSCIFPVFDLISVMYLNLKDQVNNSSLELSYADLVLTSLTSSANQLNSLLEEKEININVDYSDFFNFIHFYKTSFYKSWFSYCYFYYWLHLLF